MKRNMAFRSLVIACLTIVSFELFAQDKKLRIGDDGFRWYEIRQDGYYGAENANHEVIIPLIKKYDYLSYEESNKGWFRSRQGNKWAVCDKNGVELFPLTKCNYVAYNNKYGFEYIEVKSSKNKYGVYGRNGKEIVPTKYDYVGYDPVVGCFKVISKEKSGAIGKDGRVIVEPKYKSLSYFYDTFGYFDKSNNWVSLGISLSNPEPVQIISDSKKLHNESDGFKWYEIEESGVVSVVTSEGEMLIPSSMGLEEVSYSPYEGGWFRVKKNGKEGAFDKNGNEIVPPELYDKVWYRDGDCGYQCCVVKQGNLWGACDAKGNEIIKPQYDEVRYDVVFGYYEVKSRGYMGACDQMGREIIQPMFKEIDYKNHSFRYKNDIGDWIPLYITLDENVTYISEEDGFRWRKIEKGGFCAAQDIEGMNLIKLEREYDSIKYVTWDGGWFAVMKDGKMGACDKDGYERVAPIKYDIACYRNVGGHEYYVVSVDNAYGVCSRYGREVINPKYDMVFYMKDEPYYAVKLNGKWGACNEYGREIVAPVYEDLSYSVESDEFFGQNNAGNWIPLGVTLNLQTGSTSSNNTSGMTKEEKVMAVLQVLGAVANALQEGQNTVPANQPSYNDGGNVAPNYNYTPSSSNNTNTSKPKVDNTCLSCHGNGVCVFCGNNPNLKINCSQCNGTGICKHCHGRGYKIGVYTK